MRHKNSGRKFDRNTSSRRAMLRNLAANLILHERIETTDAKAKELRRVAERLITKARRLGEVAYTPQADLSPADKARRLAAARNIAAYIPRFGVRVETGGATTRIDLVEKVLLDLARRYAKRAGGYTRIVKFGPRRGDGAPISLIELVEDHDVAPKADEGEKKGAKAKAKSSKKATAAAPTEGAKVE
jgi:large subunit ribosomal protein L17